MEIKDWQGEETHPLFYLDCQMFVREFLSRRNYFGNTVRCGCIIERLSVRWIHWLLKTVYRSVSASRLVMATVPNRLISKSAPRRPLEALKVLGFFIGEIVFESDFVRSV